MPRENKENPENMENRPRPDRPEHPIPDNTYDAKNACHCQDGKLCLCNMYHKHWWFKLGIALLIFLAGFGMAMMCRCMSHKHSARHCAMLGQHSMARYTDGAGNVIIVNTDGRSADIMGHKMPKATKAPAQHQMPMQQTVPAQNMQIQNLPMMPIDEE